MNFRDAVRSSLASSDMICQGYLGDLSDEELLARPTPKANHIAWQLGHLIRAEHGLIDSVCPGSMPALPAGFADKYSKETASLDDPAAFDGKQALLDAWQAQRQGTLAALDAAADDDFDKPAPPEYHQIAKTVGEMFLFQATHWLMHAGQWAVVRRGLGRPPLF